MGTAILSCNRLTFFDVDIAHCIFRGAAKILFLLFCAPSAGSNLEPTLSRTRMCPSCSRRFADRSGSISVAWRAFKCSRVRERVCRKESVSIRKRLRQNPSARRRFYKGLLQRRQYLQQTSRKTLSEPIQSGAVGAFMRIPFVWLCGGVMWEPLYCSSSAMAVD
jgi:hypothetical protein